MSMNEQALERLTRAVQRNCDISDARHGADYSLCVYLMKMREYYRWEQGIPLGAALSKDRVGDWLLAREQLWEELAEAELSPLPIDGASFDPFDDEAVNARLADHGLVYSAGLGNRGKPHFFLANLERQSRFGACAVFVAAAEHARDLTAPPAMTRGQSIFLRRESLRRLVWERLEGWRWTRADNALGRAFACYDFEEDLMGSLDAMTEHEIAAVLRHEEGEYHAEQVLGTGWGAMLMDLTATPAELMARAVRDHLADCSVTLPALLAEGDAASLHFYLGNLSAMRRELFPRLQGAYEAWRTGGDRAPLHDAATAGRDHWLDLARAMMALHAHHGGAAAKPIEALVRERYL